MPTPGMGGMSLIQDGEQYYRCLPPVQFPGNDREFLVDFTYVWGGKYPHWSALPEPGGPPLRITEGVNYAVSWAAPATGSTVEMRGNVRADLAGFSFLRVRVVARACDRVTVRALIDDQWQTVVADAPGTDIGTEFQGPISGQRLQAVALRCRAGQAGPVSFKQMWVMLVKPGSPTPWPVPDAAWPGMFAPPRPVGTPPRLLVAALHTQEEIVDCRAQLSSPELASFWAKHLANGEALASQYAQPELSADPVIPFLRARWGRPHLQDRAEGPRAAHELAWLGLIAGRDDWRRLALRWVLTWTRCDRWVQFGLENIPEIPFGSGCFVQARIASIASAVLDWCGELLTPDGQAIVAEAIHRLGVLDIDPALVPGALVWGMNQGIVFERGCFVSALTIRRWHPEGFAARIERASKMLEYGLNACILDDGSALEGAGYLQYTVSQVPELALAIARATGRPVAEIYPPRLRLAARWAWINRSQANTNDRETIQLHYADCHVGVALNPATVAFYAGPLACEEYRVAAEATWPAGTSPEYLGHMAALRRRTTRPVPPVPPLVVFEVAQHLSVQQADFRSGMRFFLLSGPIGSHVHPDKNSFILEGAGQPLLIDRGKAPYGSASSGVEARTIGHNTIAANDEDQTAGGPRNPAARLVTVHEQDGLVTIESDATAAWQGIGNRVRQLGQTIIRRLWHLRPDILVVADDLTWEYPVVSSQNWHSYWPWTQEGDAWVMRADDGVALRLRFLHGPGASVVTEPYGTDGDGRIVYRLRMLSPLVVRARFLVAFDLLTSAAHPWPLAAARYDHDTEALTLTRPGQSPRLLPNLWQTMGTRL